MRGTVHAYESLTRLKTVRHLVRYVIIIDPKDKPSIQIDIREEDEQPHLHMRIGSNIKIDADYELFKEIANCMQEALKAVSECSDDILKKLVKGCKTV